MSEVVAIEDHQEKRRKVPGSGRKPGSLNKFTRELKEAMFAAAENQFTRWTLNILMLPAHSCNS
jgi:hypothetical protein